MGSNIIIQMYSFQLVLKWMFSNTTQSGYCYIFFIQVCILTPLGVTEAGSFNHLLITFSMLACKLVFINSQWRHGVKVSQLTQGGGGVYGEVSLL